MTVSGSLSESRVMGVVPSSNRAPTAVSARLTLGAGARPGMVPPIPSAAGTLCPRYEGRSGHRA
jgi:hypothetical protein